MQKLLVLALQLVVQGNAFDMRATLLEALGFTLVRAVDLRVVLDLARLLQLGIKPLSPVIIAAAAIAVLPVAAAAALLAMRFQQIPPALGQDDDTMAVTRHRHSANEPLLAEMPQIAFARVTRPAVVVP